MWGNFIDNAKAVAEKAQAAAEKLEESMNESVGAKEHEAQLIKSSSSNGAFGKKASESISSFAPMLASLSSASDKGQEQNNDNTNVQEEEEEDLFGDDDDGFYDDDDEDFDVDMHDDNAADATPEQPPVQMQKPDTPEPPTPEPAVDVEVAQHENNDPTPSQTIEADDSIGTNQENLETVELQEETNDTPYTYTNGVTNSLSTKVDEHKEYQEQLKEEEMQQDLVQKDTNPPSKETTPTPASPISSPALDDELLSNKTNMNESENGWNDDNVDDDLSFDDDEVDNNDDGLSHGSEQLQEEDHEQSVEHVKDDIDTKDEEVPDEQEQEKGQGGGWNSMFSKTITNIASVALTQSNESEENELDEQEPNIDTITERVNQDNDVENDDVDVFEDNDNEEEAVTLQDDSAPQTDLGTEITEINTPVEEVEEKMKEISIEEEEILVNTENNDDSHIDSNPLEKTITEENQEEETIGNGIHHNEEESFVSNGIPPNQSDAMELDVANKEEEENEEEEVNFTNGDNSNNDTNKEEEVNFADGNETNQSTVDETPVAQDELLEIQQREVQEEEMITMENNAISERSKDVLSDSHDFKPSLSAQEFDLGVDAMDESIGDTAEKQRTHEEQVAAQCVPLVTTPIPAKESILTPYSKPANDAIIQDMKEQHKADIDRLEAKILEFQTQLANRESQLESKAIQFTTMSEMHEKEKDVLKQKVRDTKDEAKKRVTKAKERVAEMQSRLDEANARAENAGSRQGEQEGIIQALRSEGEALAKKQSDMEQLVRDARNEIRDLKDDLEDEKIAKEKATSRNDLLDEQLTQAKEELRAVRDVKSRASKLDSDLLAAREEKEKHASAILALESDLKEAKRTIVELQKEMEQSLKGKTAENEVNKVKLLKEKDEILQDFESKLKISERESNLREDSLRNEVAELRKRWQDAVRRADALSIDLQQSSAPLIRQLESTERQSRARAAAWTDLETKLRSELEEHVITNEKQSKDNHDLRAETKRLNRLLEDKQEHLSEAENKVEELKDSYQALSVQHKRLKTEVQETKENHDKTIKTMKETETNMRNNMLKTLHDNEEESNNKISLLDKELEQEKEKRTTLEEKVQSLLFNSHNLVPEMPRTEATPKTEQKEQRLTAKANQADILQHTLLGLDEDENKDKDKEEEHSDGDEATTVEDSFDDHTPSPGGGSFALMEQLSQALKASKVERDALQKQLQESEEIRERLLFDLAKNSDASEQLPNLQTELVDLRRQLDSKELEIQGLRDDMMEMRQMYRSQLDILLEDQAVANLSAIGTPAKKGDSHQVSNNELQGSSEGSSDQNSSTIDALATGFGIM